MSPGCHITSLLLLIAIAQGGSSVVILPGGLQVPRHVLQGSSARLTCRYQLSPSETLYALKWYKSGREFYRYLPREGQPIQVFPVPGVYVNLAESNATVVTLLEADIETSGKYRCEVSAEAPSFDTDSDFRELTVVVLPESGPLISGGQLRYEPGDIVKVTCHAGPSRPAPTLTWFINGEHVNTSYLRGPYIKRELGGLESSRLELKFVVESRHFVDGDLKLKCSSTIATLYWDSLEEKMEDNNLPHTPLSSLTGPHRADRVLSSSSSSGKSTCSLRWFIATCVILKVYS